MTSVDFIDAFIRLGLASLCGMLIGINRDVKAKTAGMRTLALVALGAGLVTMVAATHPEFSGHPDAESRVLQGVIQGVLAGIGFIGAGAILRHGRHDEVVHGVTTAATVWTAAALGIACGLARWPLVAVALFFVFLILIVAKPIERWILDWFGVEEKPKAPSPPPADAPPAESP
ncbi:MgtC/SapB family protein [Kaistia geumhonensis]|uniref:Protein MgtC n=1 Tax=Kaistia geumhonensis TaxID=410839 RepID=A0ABU0M5D3_9HYPH|nr:MgtC/SapB family protein [Kaistia geumhonensis]MCX5478737.1 MgtC/SapB family protein [Kaistia geumhonensis]MDQ0516045.1 putative Mg2+ transporter-C (MgtC) family protein [Kaistia geumhonensis]